MRDILFKAKKLNGSEWVIGSYVHTFNEDKKCPVVGVMTENHWIVEISGNMILIDKETICQYTGLTDKNGNKIWENDIVHLFGVDTIRNYDWKAVVKFGNPNSLYSWGYQLKPIGHFEYNEDILCWVDMEEANIYCEVIGNKFDNLELLRN